MIKDKYAIVFNFKKQLDKSIMVQKKTKKMNKVFFIPNSIIIESSKYRKYTGIAKDVGYFTERIQLVLPRWYCEKELGFYK